MPDDVRGAHPGADSFCFYADWHRRQQFSVSTQYCPLEQLLNLSVSFLPTPYSSLRSFQEPIPQMCPSLKNKPLTAIQFSLFQFSKLSLLLRVVRALLVPENKTMWEIKRFMIPWSSSSVELNSLVLVSLKHQDNLGQHLQRASGESV